MARAQRMIEAHSGLARGREEALASPLCAISRPLYIGRPGEPVVDVEPWKLASNPDLHPKPSEFDQLLRTRRAFVLGGTRIITGMELLPTWFKDQATRNEALNAISQRSWREPLNALEFKDNSRELFRKSEISNYFYTLPPIRRPTAQPIPRVEKSSLEIWTDHRLRLRKVIEMGLLTEFVVKWRFSLDEGKNKFRNVTGMTPNEAIPEMIWDYIWIEPVLYLVDPEPAISHIDAILNREELVGRFVRETGHSIDALYWLLRGVPSKYRTAAIARDICDAFYGSSVPSSNLVTVRPDEFVHRMDLRKNNEVDGRYSAGAEYLPELGPELGPADGVTQREASGLDRPSVGR